MTTRPDFGTRLRAAMDQYGPLCVGIDPHASLLAKWGLPDGVTGLREFSFTVLDALGGKVAAVKPQAAFFERFGSAGMAVLEDVIAYSRELGTLCIVDAKRGDIGSTMEGYASAFLSEGSPLAGDAVTLSPYLGFGSLKPAIDTAIENGRGVFVLCLTSNPEGATVQHAFSPAANQTVAAQIAADAAKINIEYLETRHSAGAPEGRAAQNLGNLSWQREPQIGPFTIRPRRSERWSLDGAWPAVGANETPVRLGPPLGPVGLVVGATIGDAAASTGTDLAAVNGPFLAPGVGAQGGGAAELRQVFGDARRNVLASSSREILNAGPNKADLLAAAQKSAAQAAQALNS